MKDSQKEVRLTRPSKEGINREVNQGNSLKFNLAENPGKGKGKMVLAGSISMVHPSISKADARFTTRKPSFEFDTHLDSAVKPQLEFDLWLILEDADITIGTSYAKEDIIFPSVCIEIKDGSGRELDITLSVEQARVLHDFLEHYIDAFYAFHCLTEKRQVKAA